MTVFEWACVLHEVAAVDRKGVSFGVVSSPVRSNIGNLRRKAQRDRQGTWAERDEVN